MEPRTLEVPALNRDVIVYDKSKNADYGGKIARLELGMTVTLAIMVPEMHQHIFPTGVKHQSECAGLTYETAPRYTWRWFYERNEILTLDSKDDGRDDDRR